MTHTKDEASVKELQRYSPDGEGGMELDSLGAYIKLQDVTTPPAAPVQKPVATVIKKGADRQWMSERLASLPDGIYSLYTTPPAHPAVPDAMTSADIQEHIEYVAGWNDCRQAMMEMMK